MFVVRCRFRKSAIPRRLWPTQPIEYRRVGRIYGYGRRAGGAGAGQIEPLTGAQAVRLGLENPTDMIRRPGNGERIAADAGRNVRRIAGGVRVLHDGLDLDRKSTRLNSSH